MEVAFQPDVDQERGVTRCAASFLSKLQKDTNQAS